MNYTRKFTISMLTSIFSLNNEFILMLRIFKYRPIYILKYLLKIVIPFCGNIIIIFLN